MRDPGYRIKMKIRRKLTQYGMITVLFASAVLLPKYGVRKNQMCQVQGKAETTEYREKIVIDAGHGGDDPGMIGGSGVKEKDLNLIYALKLQKLLEQAGYQVIQTRPTEQGLYDADQTHKKAQDMQRRTAVITEEQPLLTVSIHQNSYPQDSSVCGPQVFYYAQSGEGEKLAKCIQESLNEELKIARPRVQKGNSSYYILKRSSSVTVIVECGFLTNPEEEGKLQEEAYQDQVAKAICDGILQYTAKLP